MILKHAGTVQGGFGCMTPTSLAPVAFAIGHLGQAHAFVKVTSVFEDYHPPFDICQNLTGSSILTQRRLRRRPQIIVADLKPKVNRQTPGVVSTFTSTASRFRSLLTNYTFRWSGAGESASWRLEPWTTMHMYFAACYTMSTLSLWANFADWLDHLCRELRSPRVSTS